MKGTLEERFWAKVVKTDGCWIWQGNKLRGYGRIKRDGRYVLAHRIAWELKYGVSPGELAVCHHCDTPSCVRPDHLFVGTQADNLLDCRRKGRSRHGRPVTLGERNGRARLTEGDVLEIRRIYAAGDVSQRQLARRFGVGQTQIGSILRRERWSCLP